MFHVALMISFCAATRFRGCSLAMPDIAWLCASTNSSENGLTSEEEHVASRLGRPLPAPDIAGPSVVGDHITWLNAKIFGCKRQGGRPRRLAGAGARERNDLRCAPRHGVDELKREMP